MKRSRPALALFLCTFVASLLAVGFADGESHPLSRASGLQPGDLDQLYSGFSPSCSLGFPHCVPACESSINVEGANACGPMADFSVATNWIASVWIEYWPASVIDQMAGGINDFAAFLAAQVSDAAAQPCNPTDAQLESMCADWIAAEHALAAQAASDSHFLYVLSGKWRGSRQAPTECFVDCWSTDCIPQDDQPQFSSCIADPSFNSVDDEAAILNRLSEGLAAAPAAEADPALRFVAQYFGPAHALAISRLTPVRKRQFESLWTGCDELPDASIEGWQADASRAATLQTWRAIISPMADLAGQAAQGTQGLVTIVSQQIAGWLVERSESIAAEMPPATPSRIHAPRNAIRSNEEFIVL